MAWISHGLRTGSTCVRKIEPSAPQIKLLKKPKCCGSVNASIFRRCGDLGTVTQLPLIARQTAASDSSAPVSEFGIGDVFVEPTLVRKLDPQWSIVFGARFFVPTASDLLGTGKWQVMPIMAARYEWADNSFFAPLARYAVSVAGDPSRRDISTLELQPLLNIGLSRNWFVVLYPSPDIRLNYGDPISGQTG